LRKKLYHGHQLKRKKLSQRFYATYGLPKCIGIVDGALLFLAETPEWSREDFNT
jgi:hypothetical protein